MIIELGTYDLKLADECADRRNSREGLQNRYGAALNDNPDRWLELHRLGAQCELAAAKALGGYAPLAEGTFGSKPNIPPNYSVKGVFSDSGNQDLRIRPKDWHKGWRFILVRRHPHMLGGYVFDVVGWITNEEAEAAGRQAFGDPANRFIRESYLHPVEYMMDPWHVAKRIERAERWT